MTEDERKRQEEAEQQKMQDAYLIRYAPQQGRADKLTANILSQRKENV